MRTRSTAAAAAALTVAVLLVRASPALAAEPAAAVPDAPAPSDGDGDGDADAYNGFDVAHASVDASAIVRGVSARDRIRSVDAPAFVAASEATWVVADTPVIGVEIGGEARAYPVHLLEYHQIVNDRFGDRPVVVTYDPIAGTPIVFDAEVGGERLEFGVSGLVYESNFLLYDRGSESLWSQMLSRAISGAFEGRRLTRIRSHQEAFATWVDRHPDTRVLARPLPKKIDYRYSPFQDYWISEKIPFPISTRDERHHPKAGVLGLVANGQARAYLGPVVLAAGGRVVDDFAGHRVRIEYDAGASAFLWEVPDEVEVTDAYWFAWKTFHPDTEVWSPEGGEPAPEG